MASTIKADTLQSTTSNVFVLNSAGTEYARLDSSGNLGIGISSPGAKLDVNGAIQSRGDGTEGGELRLNNITNSATALLLDIDSSNNVRMYNNLATNTIFYTNATERMRIDSSGNVKLVTAGTKVLNSSGNPILQQTGSVLQVVNGTTTSTVSSASTTVVDTGLTATITPISSTSKILVLVSQRFFKTQACSAGGTVYLQRGATNLLTDQRVCLNDTTSVGGDQTWSCCYLDSPATTSATTYKTQFGNTNTSGFFYVNLDSNQAQITLLEISA